MGRPRGLATGGLPVHLESADLPVLLRHYEVLCPPERAASG